MKMGHVTVLIPTYNHGRVLAYQLESLLKQTFPPQSIIILDDGSVDETPEILAKYQGNRTIKVIRQEQNLGLHAGLGVLLGQVDTEFFAFAAADDILARDWCVTTASLLEKYADAKMAISNTFIYEKGKVSVTDSINFPGRESEGFCEPAQYLESLMRYGLLPPTNTILYRSDIIGELIRPIMVRKELSSLIDVLLILAIATKYPIAYSTKPTGVFIRSSESYGNLFFGKDQLNSFITNIELFSVRDGYLCNPAMMFVESWIRYTWGKQLILSELAASRKDKKGLTYFLNSCFCYIRLLILFFAYKRFKFIRFSKRRNHVQGRDLKHFIDGSLFRRFDPA